MTVRRRTHARHPQSETDEYLRKRGDKNPDAVSEPGVVKMQHLVGNQAVQRMIQREIQPANKADVQRAPNADSERPTALATIVLEHQGKLRGGSRFAGHEGKIELLSLSFGGGQKPLARESDSEPQRIEISLIKHMDDTTPHLLEAMANGERVKSGKFEFIRTDDEGKVEVFHTLEHSDGMITSFQAVGSDKSGKPLLALTIEFVVKPKK